MILDFRSLGVFLKEGLLKRKADPNLMNMLATTGGLRSFLGHSVLEFLIDSNQKTDKMEKAEEEHKHFVEIVNGSSVLTEKIFKMLQGFKKFDYMLGAKAVKIVDNNTTVSVVVRKNGQKRKVSGDYAIVATCARAVSLMAFEPPLPFLKRKAIDDVEFFGSVKVFLKFRKPFWASKNKLPIIRYGNMSTVNGGSAFSDDILRTVSTHF